MNWMRHLDESLGRDISFLFKYLLSTSCCTTPIFTTSRHFKFTRKCLICWISLRVPPYPEISSTFTASVGKQDFFDTLSFTLLRFFVRKRHGHTSPHLHVTRWMRPLMTKVLFKVSLVSGEVNNTKMGRTEAFIRFRDEVTKVEKVMASRSSWELKPEKYK